MSDAWLEKAKAKATTMDTPIRLPFSGAPSVLGVLTGLGAIPTTEQVVTDEMSKGRIAAGYGDADALEWLAAFEEKPPPPQGYRDYARDY